MLIMMYHAYEVAKTIDAVIVGIKSGHDVERRSLTLPSRGRVGSHRAKNFA
jgi:hypothetical protein